MGLENNQKKPLNQLEIHVKEEGVVKTISALNKHWVKPRTHIKFIPLPITDNKLECESAFLEEWKSETTWFVRELEWLLELESYQFWSYMIYDPGCIESLLSFLQESIPSYLSLPKILLDSTVANLYLDVLKNVMIIICRLITNKENEFQWIEKEYLANILYTNYLISIPMMFDLITTYGSENLNILKRIFETIFKIEPKYEADLKLGLQFLLNGFTTVQKKIYNEKSLSVLSDVALHALDCCFILNTLLDVYPEVRSIYSVLKVEQHIAEFYENTVPDLYKRIDNMNSNSIGIEYVNNARLECLYCFKNMVNFHIENLLKHPNKSMVSAELYLNTLTEVVIYRCFLVDYNTFYPIEVDIDIIKQACPKIDSFKLSFILEAVSYNDNATNNNVVNGAHHNGDNEEYIEEYSNLPGSSGITTNTNTITDSDIQTVLDVFPDYGDGFIRKLLAHFGNTESAIGALLEENLPQDLVVANRSEIYIPSDPQDTFFLETGIRRVNVYDGDQYDVMTQENPKCIIKKGKGVPGGPKSLKALLDDKTHVQSLKSRYQEYSMVAEGHDEYDDEYDDTFDAMAESETKATKRFGKAKNIVVDEIEDDESSEESEEELVQDSNCRPKLDFCENPEAIRARYEQNRQAKMMARGRGGSFANRSVVGQQKGKGQDEQTVHNRQNKEAHKSTRANHNRRQGATWKRSRGMIPS